MIFSNSFSFEHIHMITLSDSIAIALKSINRLHFVLSAILTLGQKSENKANLIITPNHIEPLLISYMPCGVQCSVFIVLSTSRNYTKAFKVHSKWITRKHKKEKNMCIAMNMNGVVHSMWNCMSFGTVSIFGTWNYFSIITHTRFIIRWESF